jgi:hypothetical protein
LKLFFTIGFVAVLAAGWVGFPRTLYTSSKQPLEFNHRLHQEKASQKCVDCHSITADGAFTGTPALAGCAGCHAEPMGTTANEKVLVAAWVKPGREIPWQSYARQPMNVRFSHAVHLNLGKLTCDTCHGPHGNTTKVASYQQDRISGYSRHSVSMTMSDCENCHRQKGVEAGCLGCHK